MANNTPTKVTEAAVVADLVQQAVIAKTAPPHILHTNAHGDPFVVLIDSSGGHCVQGLREFDGPRKKASAAFQEAKSFIDYVNVYADENSRVFCNIEQRAFQAIFDYHDPATEDDEGRRGEHKASFVLKFTPTMEAWLQLIEKPVPQPVLAEFLEDRYQDIEEPEGAAILELAKTLEVKNDVAYQSVQRRSDGGYDLNYKETVTTKAGQTGTLEVPAKMLLAIQVFQGGDIVRLPVRLRFRMHGASVLFALTIIGFDDLVRAEVERVRAQIAEAVSRACSPARAGADSRTLSATMMKPFQRLLFAEQQQRAARDANERVDVKLWKLDDTSSTKAVKFLCAAEHPAREVWVPRSLMGDHISKKQDPGCAFWRWEFTLPLWKAEELGIEYE